MRSERRKKGIVKLFLHMMDIDHPKETHLKDLESESKYFKWEDDIVNEIRHGIDLVYEFKSA